LCPWKGARVLSVTATCAKSGRVLRHRSATEGLRPQHNRRGELRTRDVLGRAERAARRRARDDSRPEAQ
jgi:hypothetical protein